MRGLREIGWEKNRPISNFASPSSRTRGGTLGSSVAVQMTDNADSPAAAKGGAA